ncbi:hypothetical protein [Chitinilyticum piscinae]|uniref:Uncharacterized protein n=1 Tax=Chitinilyticum piscinae TaxID=2866724 RepID=A0A8J7FGF3_9NEIS|nr:hypothetical protein [Chitinilyticum piscinae]MBE9608650.1 hypothetical protein [Chitinilyticum piscinae]
MEIWSSLTVLGAIVFSLGGALVLFATFAAIMMLAGRKEKRWLTGIGVTGILVGFALAWPAPAEHADKAWLSGVVLSFAVLAPFYAFRQRASEGWLWKLFWRGWLLTLTSFPLIFAWLIKIMSAQG